MNVVEKAQMRPHHCAVFPQLGSAHRDGYLDTGTDLDGPGVYVNRVYVSVVAVREMARQLGWRDPADVQALRDELDAVREELEAATERADAAEAIVDSIDVIESAAFRARKKSGKPRREAVSVDG